MRMPFFSFPSFPLLPLLLLLLLLPLLSVLARPTPQPLFGIAIASDNETSTATPTLVSNATIDADLVRPARFAQIAYCQTALVTSSAFGAVVPGVEVLQTGGDDGLVPLYYIAYDSATQSIVVAHQGTNTENILSIENDVQIGLTDLNTTDILNNTASLLGSGESVQVHQGFQDTFERTADEVLSGVTSALAAKGVKKVAVTGHSLGAAISTMDAVMLRQNLDSSVEITTIVYGLPRGGNQAWADLVNANLGENFTHITNQNDPVPTLPSRVLGFVQPQGEIHIEAVDAQGNATSVVACPGQENEHCADGNSFLDWSIANHLGPYFQNITMSSDNCPLS